MRIQNPEDPAQAAVLVQVENYFAGKSRVFHSWHESFTAPVGSAQFSAEVQRAFAGLQNDYREILQQALRILSEPGNKEPEWFGDDRLQDVDGSSAHSEL